MNIQNLIKIFSYRGLKRRILAQDDIDLLGNHVVDFLQFSDGDVELMVKLKSGCINNKLIIS